MITAAGKWNPTNPDAADALDDGHNASVQPS
jgi:hypothetical protein